jgi:hypothetical protein
MQQPCAACGRHGRSEPAHVISRKRGSWDGDWSVLAPLCNDCHRRYDTRYANSSERFMEATDVDLLAHSRRHAEHALAVACQRYPERAGDWREAFYASRVARI